jgi:hypothetical protein
MSSYDIADRKLTAVVRTDLSTAEVVNVVGHMSIALGLHLAHLGSGIGTQRPFIGEEFVHDGCGNTHRRCARYPLIVVQSRAAKLQRLVDEANALAKENSELVVMAFPRAMLATAHDEDLERALAAVTRPDLIDYVGVMLAGPTAIVRDALTPRHALWTDRPSSR